MGVQASKQTNPLNIVWHRTSLTKERTKEVHARSDLKGLQMAGGFVAMLGWWFGLALYCQAAGRPWLSLLFTLTYGCQANFLINGMHELGHGYVFKTKALNSFFLRLISFLGMCIPH